MKTKHKHRFINGSKGMVALFMAVILAPFLTIAMSLVESGRYKSTISIIDEAMGSANISTLSNYDTFLQDRFGVYGLSQKTTEDEYLAAARSYIEASLQNDATLDNLSLNLNDTNPYTLANPDVLESQILDFSLLNSPTAMAMSFADIGSLLDKFQTLSDIGDFVDILNSFGGAVDGTLNAVQQIEDMEKLIGDIKTNVSLYETKYTEFKDAVDTIISKKKDLANLSEPTPPVYPGDSASVAAKEKYTLLYAEYESELADYNSEKEKLEKAIDKAGETATTKKGEYSKVIGDLSTDITAYVNAYNELCSAVSTVAENAISATDAIEQNKLKEEEQGKKVDEAKKAVTTMEEANADKNSDAYKEAVKKRSEEEKKLADIKYEKAVLDTEKNIADGLNDSMKDLFKETSEAGLSITSAGMSLIKSNVDNFVVSNVTKDSASLDASTYHPSVYGFVSDEDLEKYLEEERKKVAESGLDMFIESVETALDALFDLDLLFDPELVATINADFYKDVGGLPGGVDNQNSVLTIVEEGVGLATGTALLHGQLMSARFLEILGTVKSMIDHAIKLAGAIAKFFTNLVVNFAELVNLTKWNVSAYSAFNFPCRTDYSGHKLSFKSLTGTKPKVDELNITEKYSEWDTTRGIGGIVDFGEIAKGICNHTFAGDHYAFRGAELEYILTGSTSELKNQTMVFFEIYLIRFLMDYAVVNADVDLLTLAGTTTIGAPIVMTICSFVEPFLDTVSLVNGGKVDFIKTDAYISPTGLPKYVVSLVTGMYNSSGFEQKVKSGLIGAFGGNEADFNAKIAEEKAKAQAEKEAEEKAQAEEAKAAGGEGAGGDGDGEAAGGAGGGEAGGGEAGGGAAGGGGSEDKKSSVLSKGLSDWGKGMLKFSYREYCFFLLMLTATKADQIARISNIIQMEGTMKYDYATLTAPADPDAAPADAPERFDLHKAYTYVETEADVTVKEMLPTLFDSDLYTVKRKVGRGY